MGLRFYEHMQTGRPLCIVIGANPEVRDRIEIVGYRMTYRLPGETMNMQIDCPMDALMIQVVLNMINLEYTKAGKAKDAQTEKELFQKTLFASNKIRSDADIIQPGPEPKAAAEAAVPPPPSAKRQKTNDNEEELKDPVVEECRICMDSSADTIVLPCMCQVVCQKCSDGLGATNDAKTCVACRNPITNVVYPDSSIRDL